MNKGSCVFCKEEINKNKRQIISHIKKCEISKSKPISNIFKHSDRIDYMYDFGSLTTIQLKLIDEFLVNNININILILFRNNEIQDLCSECHEINAKWICNFCYDDEDRLICNKCISKHYCTIENGDEILLPITNSPRSGVCGYSGSENDHIKKYFLQ